jgi:hypothetical protein
VQKARYEGAERRRMRLRDLLARAESHLSRHGWLFALAAVLTGVVTPVAVKSAHGATWEAVRNVVVFGLLLGLAGRVLDALGLARSAIVAFLVGAAVRTAYLMVTPYSVRTHDADQHVEYVEYLLAHHAVPKPSDGWAFYHPPLYYLIAAVLWRGLVAVGVTKRPVILVGLQLQSLVYHLGFLAFALFTGQRWLARVADERLGPQPAVRCRLAAIFAALMCLWPSGIIHSVRVGNDDASYLAFGGVLLFASRWWQLGRDRDFYAATAFASMAMFVKSNGLVAFALLGALFVAHFIRDDRRSVRGALRRAGPALVAFAVPTTLTLVRAIKDLSPGQHHNLLVGNSDRITDAIAVGNGAANYLWLDFKMLLTQPYSTSWSDDAGRQYFANFALKTSLLGDFQYDGHTLANLAIVMSFLFVPILACVALGAAYQTRNDWIETLPLWLMIGLAVMSLALLRMSIPKACSNDFRYILPILMPSLYLYARALARLRELGRLVLARWGEAAGWAFACVSVAFFVVLVRLG